MRSNGEGQWERGREREREIVYEDQEYPYLSAGNFCQKISDLLKPKDIEKLSLFREILFFFVLYSKSELIAVTNDSGAWFPGC